jgi:hypothetical protein
MKKARSGERAFFALPVDVVSGLDVVLGDLAAVVQADTGADHADHDCGRESNRRPKGPAGVAADGGANESEEFSHIM